MVAKVGVLGPPKCRKVGNCSNRWGTKHRSSILETLLWTCFLGFTTIYSCVDIVPKVFFHCQGIFLPAYSWTWNHRGPDSTTNPQPKLQIFSFGLGISSSSKSKIVFWMFHDVSPCAVACFLANIVPSPSEDSEAGAGVQVVMGLIMMLLVNHIIACLWYGMGSWSDPGGWSSA